MSGALQKFLINLIATVVAKLGGMLLDFVKEIMDETKIKREQEKKKRAVQNAKTPEDIKSAHRNNRL